MKNMRNNKGETLVETIVSFLVVLMTLATITAVVQLSIRLNTRAVQKADALEAASSMAEGLDMGAPLGQGGLRLQPQYEGEAAGSTIAIPFQLYQHSVADMTLWYFDPPTVAGGGG